jgi:hypothetical protein
MATFVEFDSFPEAMAEGAHNLGSDTLTIALTNTAPTPTTDTQLSNITQIAYTNLSSRVITTSSSSSSGGTYSLVLTDLTLTASGSVGPFRYVVVYNDTATNDELLCYWDYGSAVTMASSETFDVDFGATLFTGAFA